MLEDVLNLTKDVIAYCKDPLWPKQTLFVCPEDQVFFAQIKPQKNQETASPLPRFTPSSVSFPQPTKKVSAPPLPSEPEAATIKISPPKAPAHSSNIKQTLLKIAPQMQLVEEVPDDGQAKRIADAWKEKIADAEVILLACSTDPQTLDLLKNLGKAIDQHLAKVKILPAEKLEKEKRWDLFLQKNPFRLIIASHGVEHLSDLMRFYKAYPSQSTAYLGAIPLLTLSETASYKALEHKAALWKKLCQILQK